MLVRAQSAGKGKLKLAIAVIAIFAGLQLVWSGSRTMIAKRTRSTVPSSVEAAPKAN